MSTEAGASGQAAAVTADTPFDAAQHAPEAIRTEPYFESFKGKTLGDVLKSGLEAHKAVGGSVRIPGDDAKPEEWTAFYGKLRPESVDKYKTTFTDEKIEKLIVGDGKSFGAIKQSFWEAGLSQRQVDHVLKVYSGTVAAEQINLDNSIQLGVQEGTNKLKEQYKDDFEQSSILANRAARRFGGDDFVQMIKDYHLQADPTFFNTFVNIAKAVQEDSWHTGDAPKFLSRDAAAKQVAEIIADKSHAYHNASHKHHDAAVSQVDGLRKIQFAKKDEE